MTVTQQCELKVTTRPTTTLWLANIMSVVNIYVGMIYYAVCSACTRGGGGRWMAFIIFRTAECLPFGGIDTRGRKFTLQVSYANISLGSPLWDFALTCICIPCRSSNFLSVCNAEFYSYLMLIFAVWCLYLRHIVPSSSLEGQRVAVLFVSQCQLDRRNMVRSRITGNVLLLVKVLVAFPYCLEAHTYGLSKVL